MFKYEDNSYDIMAQLKNESLFMIGNGYIGVRGAFEEGYPSGDSVKGSYINGLYDRLDMVHAEKAVGFPTKYDKQPKVADTQTCLVFLDGEPAQLINTKYQNYRRYIDYEKGETVREYEFLTRNNKIAYLKFRRLASFVNLNVVSYSIEVKYDGEIVLLSILDGDVKPYSDPNDPRISNESKDLMEISDIGEKDDTSYLLLNTKNTSILQATLVKHLILTENDYSMDHIVKDERVETRITGSDNLILNKICVFTDGIRYSDPLKSAWEILGHLAYENYQTLLEIQKNYLDKFWDIAGIKIYGNDNDQNHIRFMQYQLLQNVGIDPFSNVSAKGLSGEGYEGHFFWDTEIYIFPVLVANQPQRAKNLLEYRYNILERAKERAVELGHKKGAAYPWRTISGIECSGYFPASTAQYHINADIAYAFYFYYEFTKDLDFMVEKGLEVIFETARIWIQIGNFFQDKFHIHEVTGPDEYTALVSDNYYTNMMAKFNLNKAYELYKYFSQIEEPTIYEKFKLLIEKINLDEEEINMMKRAADNMVLLEDEELGIYAQDSTFLKKPLWDLDIDKRPLLLYYHPLTIYRYQILKQADVVLAHLLLEEYADYEKMKNSYEYYEKITTHDSSLSYCIYGIMANRFNMVDKAYDYFNQSVLLDLHDTHRNTKDGLHLANIGGTVLSVIQGFAGLRLNGGNLYFRPSVPSQWEGYSFKISFRNCLVEIDVRREILIKLLEGEYLNLFIYDKEYKLKKGEELRVAIMEVNKDD